MKVLFTDYTFNSTNKTVTFNTKNVINLNNILLITNVTRNIIIYNFANPSLGGTLSNNVLTLTYNTTTMSSSDLLQIFLDLGEFPASEDTLVRISQLLTPIATQDSAQRQRIIVDNASVVVSQGTAANLNATVSIAASQTLGTVTTVSSVTNIAGLGGVDPRFQFIDIARNSYANGVRNNLSFS